MKVFIALLLLISIPVFLMFVVAFIEHIWKLDMQQLKRLYNHRDKRIQFLPKFKNIDRYTGW